MQRTIRRRLALSTATCALLAALAINGSGAAAQGGREARRAADTRQRGPSAREPRLGDHLIMARKKVRVVRHKLAPGLVFTKIIDERTPRRIFVLRADVASFPITYDITLAGATLGYRATVPRMAKANGALAAVNGDFSYRVIGRPVHAFVEDGTFVQSAGPGGASFAVSKNEQRVMAGAPQEVMTTTDSQTGLTWRIDRWNHGAPDVGEIAAFSPAGGSLETPPAGACSIHLTPTGPETPSADRPGFEQPFSIDRSACSAEPIAVGKGVVLSAVAGTDEATMLRSFALGTAMTIHLSLGWSEAYDVIGGDTMLVHEGRTMPCAGVSCSVQPRTAIGAQADGTLLLVVVDGRQPNWSLGLTHDALARLMRQLGAVEAINLDGGGASTMVVEGEVVNRPSDGSLRHVTTAAMILPGPDPDEP
jgi:hypothetical protein